MTAAPIEAEFDRQADAPRPLFERALALQHARDFTGAEELYRRFLATHPKDLGALNNAALVAKALGKRDLALTRLAKAVRHHPDSPEAHFNLANTLQEIGRLEAALPHYRRAIALRPGYAKAHLNLGNAFDNLRRFDEAAACYEKSLALGGESGETHANLAQCLKQQGRVHEALVHFTCATMLEPNRADFHYGVGIAQFELRENEKAIAAFQRVLELESSHEGARNALLFQAQLACDWAQTTSFAPAVRAATDVALAAGGRCCEGAFESVTRDADPRRNLAVAQSSAAGVTVTRPASEAIVRRRKAPGDKLKLGYLSGDFREHPVAQVMSGVFRRHDRQRFTVTAYSYGIDDDSRWRREIAAGCDRFVDMHRMSDEQSARLIAEDEVDILIDLTLWTHGNRVRICAARPAAIQVQYLGFPGTSGAAFYDYAIVDHVVVPPPDRPFWSERLVFMPRCYFITNNDGLPTPVRLRRRDCNLRDDALVLCSFNQSYKIEPVVFDAWMRIMAALPGSILWLLSYPPVTMHNLEREAEKRGIAAERLIFAARLDEKAQHLERLALADIALDTFAYNGHTTTSDALWAGVPVLTLRGKHFASRAGASLLEAANLPELVATSIEDYVEHGIALGRDRARRERLRSFLAQARNTAPLFDADASVAALERAFERMWAIHRLGRPPTDIDLAEGVLS